MTILNKKQIEVLDFGLAAKVRGLFCCLKMLRKSGNTLVPRDGAMMGTGGGRGGGRGWGKVHRGGWWRVHGDKNVIL